MEVCISILVKKYMVMCTSLCAVHCSSQTITVYIALLKVVIHNSALASTKEYAQS